MRGPLMVAREVESENALPSALGRAGRVTWRGQDGSPLVDSKARHAPWPPPDDAIRMI